MAKSPDFRCVSMKSDSSMIQPLNFRDESVTFDPRIAGIKQASSENSRIASLNRKTLIQPPNLIGAVTSDPRTAEFSCVSMKSNSSMIQPLNLSDGPVISDPSSPIISVKSHQRDPLVGKHNRTEVRNKESKILDIDVLHRVKETHKVNIKHQYELLFEGVRVHGHQTLLNEIYTQLCVTEGESESVNKEHEVLQMEETPKRVLQDTLISCNDIFDSQCDAWKSKNSGLNLKTVLTKGIAGNGKTVSVQKFLLDWAEGRANQDVDFMFVLPFRQLNFVKGSLYSLHQLLQDFYPELRDLDYKVYELCKVVFVFDGLDECRMNLMFSHEVVSDPTQTSSVSELVTNVIEGHLLPSALIWITSRPAAANQIPRKHISRVTEIQGFGDAQKELYFQKRIRNEARASSIISHIKRARSLFIMCHIPIFCWISASVLEDLLERDDHAEIPQTLTEMYIHFLLIQIQVRNQKCAERDPEELRHSSKDVIVKLSELAFLQLMKGNILFEKEDLRESGIDMTEATIYCGIFTEILKEESVIFHRKVYCFIHMSFQEFLAALFKFHSHEERFFGGFLTLPRWLWSGEPRLNKLLKDSVDESLQSENGHLDLYLRFLLGISLESNQRMLGELLTPTVKSSDSIAEVSQYIRGKIKSCKDLSAHRSTNLFLALLEVKDQILTEEILCFIRSERQSLEKLSAALCSVIAFMLQMSKAWLDELDLRTFNTTEEGWRRLIPALVKCRKAKLSETYLTGECWESVSAALQASDCVLKELDVSSNDLRDSGVQLLCEALKTCNRSLLTLRLSSCNLTDLSCEHLSAALQASDCVLKELDVSDNDLRDSGVQLLCEALKNISCRLETLRLARCNLTDLSCEHLSAALQASDCVLKELDVSDNDLRDSGVQLLCEALKNISCRLETLRMQMCNLTDLSCEHLSAALQASDCVLKELDVSDNDLRDSGVQLLCEALKNISCRLETLRLCGCMVTQVSCWYLSSALISNPSHLRRLDLQYNNPGDAGVQLLKARQEDPLCRLQELKMNHGGEHMITAGLLKYGYSAVLDMSSEVGLSQETGTLTYEVLKQSFPRRPDRLQYSRHFLQESERCFWDVEWDGRQGVVMSVKFKGGRKAQVTGQCAISHRNNEAYQTSWSVAWPCGTFILHHHTERQRLVAAIPVPHTNRAGVFMDCAAGTLTFYSISNSHTFSRIYTVTSTFTNPLYARLMVDFGSQL